MALKITLPRGELKKAVAGLSKVVNGRSTLPILQGIRIGADDGQVVATGTDLDQTLGFRFAEADVESAGTCILGLNHLKDLTKGANKDAVEIQAAGDRVTVINHIGSQQVRLPLSGMDPDEWPVCPVEVDTKPADGFLETYRRLIPFASTDTAQYILNSVYVEVADKGGSPVTMVATDGRRLSLWNMINLPLERSVIIPTTKFLSWTGLKGDVAIGLRTERVKKDVRVLGFALRAGPWFYEVKAIEGTFPNYRQVIPAEDGAHRIVFADGDVEVLKQMLPTFPGGDKITVVGDGGKVTLYGRGPDDEQWTRLKLDGTRYEGKRTFVGLNRHFLLDALTAGFRTVSITDELSPVVSRDAEGGTHVLMPMRVLDPEEAGTAGRRIRG